MKFLTSLHDTLHAVTDRIRSDLKRLRRSSTTTSSAHQAAGVQTISTAKRLRKRPRPYHSQIWMNDKRPATEFSSISSGVLVERSSVLEESERQLHCLASLQFSTFNAAGAVLMALKGVPEVPISTQLSSPTLSELLLSPGPPTSADTSPRNNAFRHLSPCFSPVNASREVLAPLSEPQIDSLQSTLAKGLWTEIGTVNHAFLQDFMSDEKRRAIAEIGVPSILARSFSQYENNPLDFMAQGPPQPQLGSWESVLQRFSSSTMEESNGSRTWLSHRIIGGHEAVVLEMASEGPSTQANATVALAANFSALTLISNALVREPTTLIIKHTWTPDPDSEISFFSFSKGNRITNLLPLSLNSLPAQWSRLEELAIDCFISDADVFMIFNECKSTLRTAFLNLHIDQDTDFTLPTGIETTEMSVLSNLTIKSSSAFEPLAAAFAFPALRDLSLTALPSTTSKESTRLGILLTEKQTELSPAIQFPWSKLLRLSLTNANCNTPYVEDILAKCGALSSFSWGGRYSTEPKRSTPLLNLPELKELTIDVYECCPLLRSLHASPVKKLALQCCDDRAAGAMPYELTELIVQESMECGSALDLLRYLRDTLSRANISVTCGRLPGSHAPIVMSKLQDFCLRGDTESVKLLRSLVTAPNLLRQIYPE